MRRSTDDGGDEPAAAARLQASSQHNGEVDMDVEKAAAAAAATNNVSGSLLNKETEKPSKELRVFYKTDTYATCSSHTVKYLIIGCLLLAAVIIALLIVMFARQSGKSTRVFRHI